MKGDSLYKCSNMVPFKSGKNCNAIKLNFNQDLLSNLPDIAIDKILKRLPIKTVAKMSILSKKWRYIWLSLKYLIFDKHFWDKVKDDDGGNYESEIRSYNAVITNIMCHHVGRVHEFYLHVPDQWDDCLLSGWISLLSKVGVRKIALLICSVDFVTLPASIFDCKNLVKLRVQGFSLNRPPSDFEGFAYLQSLELMYVEYNHDVFRTLIDKCPQLVVLMLVYFMGINDHLVIDAPNLEHLTIIGQFETIIFKNVQRLSYLSLFSNHAFISSKARLDNSIKMLASSSQLQVLNFGGVMCKYFGAGCITLLRTFKFLQRLELTEVDLSDFDVFRFTLGMIQCCPFIEDLDLSVIPEKCNVQHKFDYNKNCELGHLVKVKITNIMGSRPQLKLIEYLFSIASKLEMLAYKCYELDPISELKVTRELSKLPRASPKAKLVCLE